MAKLSKRAKAYRAQVEAGKVYPLLEALTLLKSIPAAKFVESVDVAINLGIDPRKSDQVVRGAAVLPNGTGKSVRVAVFAQGAAADAAATPDVKTAVENAKAGQVRFRADKGGVVHAMIGKVNFTEQQLAENLNALVAEVNKLRPAAAKGIYLKKAFLSTTMGPGIAIDVASFGA